MNTKFIQRKKRIFLDKRGCMYFKMNQHQVQLPKSEMEKKHVLTRLLTVPVNIRDLRKNLKQTNQTRLSQQGDPKDKFNLAMIKFKPTSQLILDKIRLELEGKSLPQIFEKLRTIKLEKQKNDQGIYFNEFYKLLENKNDTQLEDEIERIKEKIDELRERNIKQDNAKQKLAIAKYIQQLRREKIILEDRRKKIEGLEKLSKIRKTHEQDLQKLVLSALNKKIGSDEYTKVKDQIFDNEEIQKLENKKQLDQQQIIDEENKDDEQVTIGQQTKPSPLSQKQTDQLIEQIQQQIKQDDDDQEEEKQISQTSQKSSKISPALQKKAELEQIMSIMQPQEEIQQKPPQKIQLQKSEQIQQKPRIRKERDDQVTRVLNKLNEEFIKLRDVQQRKYAKALNIKNPKTMRNIPTIMSYIKDLDLIYGIRDDMPEERIQNLNPKQQSYYELREELIYLIKEDKTQQEQIFYGKGRGQNNKFGQTDIFLTEQMNKFLDTKKYFQFKKYFLGVFQQDDKRLEQLLQEKKNNKFLFWIQNTNNFDEKEDPNMDYHWFANFVDMHHQTFNVFDPSGYLDDNQQKYIKKYIKILEPEYFMKLKTNSNNIQGSNSFCGYYSMLFLLRMMSSDMDFKYSSLRDISQQQGVKILDSVFDII